MPILFILGSVVVLTMLRGSLFGGLTQPAKGAVSAVAAAVVGTVLALLYRLVMPLVTGELPAGPPTVDAEMWLANAMLAVTFPFLAFYGDFLQLWALAKAPAPEVGSAPDDRPPGQRSGDRRTVGPQQARRRETVHRPCGTNRCSITMRSWTS